MPTAPFDPNAVLRRKMWIPILLARGVWTTAAVESISSVSKGGRRPVTFAYAVNNKPRR
jgi:hypothetical protein